MDVQRLLCKWNTIRKFPHDAHRIVFDRDRTDLFRKPGWVNYFFTQFARHTTHGAVHVDQFVVRDAR